MQNLNPTLQLLFLKFDGKILIPFSAAAEAAGFAVQTARNKRVKGKFPIRVRPEGGRLFVHISDLAGYIDRDQPQVRRRGRPTKQSMIEGEGKP